MAHSRPQGSSQSLLDLLDRDRYYPIFNSLSAYLDIGETVSLSRTCKKLSTLYQELLPLRWNIDRDLRRFVKDPYEFRAQMRQHNALVAGDFAHQFFKANGWEALEIDVFINGKGAADSFLRYLSQVEGYELKERASRYYGVAIENVQLLSRKTLRGRCIRHIEIIATKGSPLSHRLNRGIAPLSIISWNKAYAIFPQFSFVDHADWSAARLKGKVITTIKEVTALKGWAKPLKSYLYAVRHIGDSKTWTIPLDTDPISEAWPNSLEPELLDARFQVAIHWLGWECGVEEKRVPLGCWVTKILDPIKTVEQPQHS